MQNKWNIVLDNLKESHSYIEKLIAGRKVCYLDIPFHFNVGDLLIYKGTERFFKDNNIKINYRSFATNCNLKKVEECDVILLHGGGNFGDIYSLHQDFREKIIKKFPHKVIICLPQSIHFNNLDELERSARVFKKHKEFFLLVRDKESLDTSTKFTDKSALIPDMAHSLHPLIDKSELITAVNPTKLLNLKRVDVEKVNINSNINKRSFDWNQIITRYDKYSHKLLSKVSRICHTFTMDEWEAQTDIIVFNSINYFYDFEEVHTDRLHGFILAYLLGKKVSLLDNSYGKNKRYVSAWFSTDDEMIKIIGSK
tara:strand:- start:11267 stop:12199 length:933 start_codon:yes stop_codon:yes gene_type:complete